MTSDSTRGRHQQVCHEEVETAAWVAVAGCIVVESLSGIMYMFGVYSPILKSTYRLSQTELDGLATATNIANNVGLWLGSGIDRLGPRTMMVAGGVAAALSWLSLWAALTYQWQLTYWQLLVIVICQGHSADAGDKSCISVMATNFPELRGTAIGITKSLVGLSAALTAAGYSTAFSPHIVPFMRIIALSFALLWTMCGYIIRIIPQHSSLEPDWPHRLQLRRWQRHRFNFLNLGVACIAVFLLLAALNPTLQHLGNSASLIMLAALVLYTTFPGAQEIALAVGSDHSRATRVAAGKHPELESEQDRLLGSYGSKGKGEHTSRSVFPLSSEFTVGGPRLVLSWYRDVDFYFVTAILFTNFGCGLMLINNLGQINPALGGSQESQLANVSIFSVCSCLGRLATGVASDWLLHTHSVPRVSFFLFSSIIMFVSMLVLVVGSPTALRLATIGTGLAFGSMNTQCPLIVSELFGMCHFAENFALVAMISATGSSFVFATALFGTLYDYSAKAQAVDTGQVLSASSAEEKARECFGAVCVRGAALVSTGCCAIAIILSLMLIQRQQRLRDTNVVATLATGTS